MSRSNEGGRPDSVPSSGTQTPTLGDQDRSGSNSYLSSMWGLIRRFSSEDTQFGGHMEPTPQQRQHMLGKDGVNDVFNPVKRTASPFRPPPLDPIVLRGYKESTSLTARLLSHSVAEEVRAMIPERLRIIEDWRLVYSLEQDGASLATLYQKCRQFEGRRVGFVLVVRDQEGAVSVDQPMPVAANRGPGAAG